MVRLIRELAVERQLPAVATLHQPRSSIWHDLDDVLLLAPGGRVAFLGSTEAALAHFGRLGHRCPPLTNPAEFLIDLVSVDHESVEAARLDLARISRLVATFAASQSRAAALAAPAAPAAPAVAPAATSAAGRVARRPGPLRRFGLLLRRAWRQNVRDAWTNGLRLGVSLGLALVFGEIYGSVGAPSAASVAERVAVLSFGAINNIN